MVFTNPSSYPELTVSGTTVYPSTSGATFVTPPNTSRTNVDFVVHADFSIEFTITEDFNKSLFDFYKAMARARNYTSIGYGSLKGGNSRTYSQHAGGSNRCSFSTSWSGDAPTDSGGDNSSGSGGDNLTDNGLNPANGAMLAEITAAFGALFVGLFL